MRCEKLKCELLIFDPEYTASWPFPPKNNTSRHFPPKPAKYPTVKPRWLLSPTTRHQSEQYLVAENVHCLFPTMTPNCNCIMFTHTTSSADYLPTVTSFNCWSRDTANCLKICWQSTGIDELQYLPERERGLRTLT